jgi:predicted HicB family RNase H-like nuclease
MLRVDPAIRAATIKAAKRERLSLNQWAGNVLAEAANAGHSGPRPVG